MFSEQKIPFRRVGASLPRGWETKGSDGVVLDNTDDSESTTSPQGAMSPSCGFPESQWDAHQDLITKLYLNDEHTLKEVRQIMMEKYGFRATDRMYKTRIEKWQIKKNYSKKDREAALRSLAEGREPSIRGQPVRMHKIDRHIRLQRNRGSVEIASAASNVLITGPMPPLRLADEYHVPEHALIKCQHYLQSCLESISVRVKSKYVGENQTLSSGLGRVVNFYARSCQAARIYQYVSARLFLDRAQSYLETALRSNDVKLLGTLLVLMVSRSSNMFETSTLFGEFALKLAGIVLGSEHPVTVALEAHRFTANIEFLLLYDTLRTQVARQTLGEKFVKVLESPYNQSVAFRDGLAYRAQMSDWAANEPVPNQTWADIHRVWASDYGQETTVTDQWIWRDLREVLQPWIWTNGTKRVEVAWAPRPPKNQPSDMDLEEKLCRAS